MTEKELLNNKQKTCSFTGHRILPNNFDSEALVKAVYKAVNDGFDTFLIGMALGFDTLCFHLLESVRTEIPVKIIACVPCDTQSKYFKKQQKKEYDRMIASADYVFNITEEYFDGCMQVRNMFMVDHSSRVIAFLNYPHGGTYSTVKYAVESGAEVVYIGTVSSKKAE